MAKPFKVLENVTVIQYCTYPRSGGVTVLRENEEKTKKGIQFMIVIMIMISEPLHFARMRLHAKLGSSRRRIYCKGSEF